MTHQHRRATAHGGAFTTAPWLRAPLLLVRQPFVFLALVGAAAILAIAAASGPLFLSTIGSASLSAQAASGCPEAGQPTVHDTVAGTELSDAVSAGVHAFRTNGLGSVHYATNTYNFVGATLVHLYSGPGALDHVTKLTPDTGARGVWIPSVFARTVHATPGSTIKTTTGASFKVAGVYRDLAPNPFELAHLPRYWCSYTNQIVSTVASDAAVAAQPPQQRVGAWLIADDATVARLSTDNVRVTFSAPLPQDTTPLSDFDAADARAAKAATAMPIGFVEQDPALAQLTTIARTSKSGISGSIVPIEVAGVIVAAILIGGAGMFWATARQREVRLLVARGVGPGSLAGKAILETLVPILIGAAVGFAATFYLVRAVGPSRAIEDKAPRQALLVVIATLLVSLLIIGLIGATAGRERTTGRRTAWWRLVPWEVGLLAIALLVRHAVDNRSAVTVDHTVVKIDPLVVMYPLLGATAALMLVGRLIGLLLPRIGRGAARRGITPYLTLRRMSRSRGIVVGLIIGTALPCCLLMYGSTVTDTVSNEVTQKYETNLGAPHALQIYGVHDKLFDPKGVGTQVAIFKQQVMLGQDTQAYVLGVDPATFSDFAFVSGAQSSAVRKLAHGPLGDAAVPAILVNAAGVPDPRELHIGTTSIQLDNVATMSVFPGMRNGFVPMIVVDEHVFDNKAGTTSLVDQNVERLNQVWTTTADYGAARKVISDYDFSVLFELTSDVVVGTTGLLPVTWLFGYLRALAILIGVVALAGLVFGLAARTRRRRVSYVLSRRMGMSKTAHLTSLVMELGLVIGLGWVAGTSLGVGSFGAVFDAFDVYPALKPAAELIVPDLPIQVTAAIAAGLVLVAAVATHLLAERTRPAEILRLE